MTAPKTRLGLSLVSQEADQVVRLHDFRQRYPAVTIAMISPRAWQALIPEPHGETVLTRRELRDLLDELELLGPQGRQ
jgi:hypothetical protein